MTAHISIATRWGIVPVEAFSDTAAPLVVTRGVRTDGPFGYVVTHRPTGMLVAWRRSLRGARSALCALQELPVDWEAIGGVRGVLDLSEDVRRRIEAVAVKRPKARRRAPSVAAPRDGGAS